MVHPVRELGIDDFEEVAKPIFEHIQTEIRDPEWEMNWDYFRYEWKKWMNLGIARTWAADGVVVGGIFYKDLFSGKPRASVMFWAALPSARRTGRPMAVLREFEKVARAGKAKIAAAVHRAVSPENLGRVYLRAGYDLAEWIFNKK